jgi:hypothetical protein
MVRTEILTTAAAYGALLVSAFSVILAARSAKAARRHADAAERATEHAQQSGAGATVIHFTNRFFDLMRNGPHFDDPDWEYQFWSLLDIEFYFFDHGWLPSFIYELWMVDLVAGYRTFPQASRSHQQHLDRLAANYPDMIRFFAHLADLAVDDFDSERERNRAISRSVSSWRKRSSTTPPPQRTGL